MKKILRQIFFTVSVSIAMLSSLMSVQAKESSEITFAHLSDIHINQMVGRDVSEPTVREKYLRDAVQEINKTPGVDFTLLSGDIVDSPDKELTAYIFKILNNLKNPWYYSLGNHDCVSWGYMPKNEFVDLLKKYNRAFKFDKETYAFQPKKGFTVIAVDSTRAMEGRTWYGYSDKETLEFLDKTLTEHKNDTAIIFMHIPLVPPVDHMPEYGFDNREEFYSVLNKHKQPIIILGGHYHATNIKRRANVVHVETPSLAYCQEYRIINIKNNSKSTVINFTYKETNVPERVPGSRGPGTEADKNTTITIER